MFALGVRIGMAFLRFCAPNQQIAKEAKKERQPLRTSVFGV
jgi:hypothetical protein